MSRNLSPENEALLAEAISRGGFASPDVALGEALRLLQRKLQLEELLVAGLESGDSIPVDESFWARKRAELARQA